MEYVIALAVSAAVWVGGYLCGYGAGRNATIRRFQARQEELMRELADVQRTVDAVDWLYSPRDES